MTVREMKRDVVARLDSFDESNEEQMKHIWLYVMKVPAPEQKKQELTANQQRRLALVKNMQVPLPPAGQTRIGKR